MQLKGYTIKLTNEEIAAYQQLKGDFSRRVITHLLAAPGFASATMDGKAAVMIKGLSAAHTAAKMRVLGSQPTLGQKFRAQAALKQQAREEVPEFAE